MQPGLSEVAGDVEADPDAVLEAQGAESVDELGTDTGTPERDAARDRAVSRLFEGDLERPERRTGVGTDRTAPATRTREAATTPEVLVDLERAIEATAGDEPTELCAEDLDALDDAEVEDALAAAEQLDDAELPESVPDEWR